MEPIPVHFPVETDEDTVRHAHGPHCFSDQTPGINAYGGSLVSNPYFVLRCARKAFSQCTFLFSCLVAPDSCAVNMSENGSFHHYQAKENVDHYEVSLLWVVLSCYQQKYSNSLTSVLALPEVYIDRTRNEDCCSPRWRCNLRIWRLDQAAASPEEVFFHFSSKRSLSERIKLCAHASVRNGL
jgi:hypothetical protein